MKSLSLSSLALKLFLFSVLFFSANIALAQTPDAAASPAAALTAEQQAAKDAKKAAKKAAKRAAPRAAKRSAAKRSSGAGRKSSGAKAAPPAGVPSMLGGAPTSSAGLDAGEE